MHNNKQNSLGPVTKGGYEALWRLTVGMERDLRAATDPWFRRSHASEEEENTAVIVP